MDFSALTTTLQTSVGSQIPQVVGAVAALIVGWLIAVIIRASVRRLLSMLKLNARLARSTGTQIDAESPVATGVFWLVMLGTLIAVLNVLNLSAVSGPFAKLLTDVMGYLPNLVAGAVLALVAWVLATVLRSLAVRALNASALDEKLSSAAGMRPMSQSAGNVLFWIVILMFLPAILNAFRMNGLLEPVTHMVNKLLEMVPNGVGALMIGGVGYLVARILSGLVTNLLGAAGADRINERVGLDQGLRLSSLAGKIVFVFVFVPSLIAALDSLKIEAISKPATQMLTQMMSAIPNIVAAVIILLLTWTVARFAASLLGSLMESAGADALPAKLGVDKVFSGATRPSKVVSGLVMFFAMLFASAEAAHQLGFAQVRELVATFIKFGGDILMGGVIMVIGFWLSNLASNMISKANDNQFLPAIARFAILGLVLAMGLRAMGIANEIVQMAFGLTLGAVAVAVALSFGLGGRDAAGRLMDHWVSKLKKD